MTATPEQLTVQMVQMLDDMRIMREGTQAAEAVRAEAGRAQAAAVVANGQIKELADARLEDRGRMGELRDQIAANREQPAQLRL